MDSAESFARAAHNLAEERGYYAMSEAELLAIRARLDADQRQRRQAALKIIEVARANWMLVPELTAHIGAIHVADLRHEIERTAVEYGLRWSKNREREQALGLGPADEI
jgi:hypothetical protein